MSSELVACTQHCTDKNILLSMHRAKYFNIYQNFLHKSFFSDRIQVLNFLYISSPVLNKCLFTLWVKCKG